ncbi:Transmembrane protein, putative [Arachis hypogaea]|nr:Transmembrane protein, putative [Arachis hypogaea]
MFSTVIKHSLLKFRRNSNMAKLGATIHSLCCFIILLLLLGEGVSVSRQNLFTSMEQENNKGISGEASTMLRASSDAFVVLKKGPIPPSGPSHPHPPPPKSTLGKP